MLKIILLLVALINAEIKTCTTDNVQQLLKTQLAEFEKPVKKQTGLIMVFVTRQSSLEFQKVIQAWEAVIAR